MYPLLDFKCRTGRKYWARYEFLAAQPLFTAHIQKSLHGTYPEFFKSIFISKFFFQKSFHGTSFHIEKSFPDIFHGTYPEIFESIFISESATVFRKVIRRGRNRPSKTTFLCVIFVIYVFMCPIFICDIYLHVSRLYL